MKKYILAIAALLMAVCANAQSVTIYKSGQAVATYDIDANTELVFSMDAASLAQAVAGTYNCHREVTLPVMPQMGVLVSDDVDLSIEAEAEATVAVSLPGCNYVLNGQSMELPAVKATGVAVTKDGNTYSLAGKFEGTVNGKTTKVDVATTITDGKIQLTEDIVYGTMPMTLRMVYTTSVAE